MFKSILNFFKKKSSEEKELIKRSKEQGLLVKLAFNNNLKTTGNLFNIVDYQTVTLFTR